MGLSAVFAINQEAPKPTGRAPRTYSALQAPAERRVSPLPLIEIKLLGTPCPWSPPRSEKCRLGAERGTPRSDQAAAGQRSRQCVCVYCTLIGRPQRRLPSRVLRAVESAEALRDDVEAQQNRLRLQLPQQRTPSARKAAGLVLRLRQCRRLGGDATCSSVNSRRFTTHRRALSSATRAEAWPSRRIERARGSAQPHRYCKATAKLAGAGAHCRGAFLRSTP
jgi:hypothetical protein